MKLDVTTASGGKAGTVDAPDDLFGIRWRLEAVAPEGDRPRPPGIDPRAAVAGWRHRPRAQAA